jgi:hypothetical protein
MLVCLKLSANNRYKDLSPSRLLYIHAIKHLATTATAIHKRLTRRVLKADFTKDNQRFFDENINGRKIL